MLARAGIKVPLQEWLTRIPDFRLDPDGDPRVGTGVDITVDYLPLGW